MNLQGIKDLPIDQILTGDCIEVLEGFPENSVDLCFADPPYNLQLQNTLYRPNMTKVAAVEDSWDKFASFLEYDQFTKAWLTACKRVLKKTGTIWVIGSYHNIHRVGAIMQDLGFWILNEIAWIKTNPMPNFRGVRFTNAHETLLWAQKEKGAKYTFNYHAMKSLNDDLQVRSDWIIPICSGSERLKINKVKAHSTQKPEALLYRIILSSTNPHDIILDPFFGSGTTGAVAKKLHRNWCGVEKDEAYVKIARQRIDSIQPTFFDEELIIPSRNKSAPRIPFGQLLENGLLQIGQTLSFGKDGKEMAIILPDGSLKHDEFIGSIHKVGTAIQNAPCNGWEHWYYLDDKTGKRLPINTLRQKILNNKGDL